MIIQTFDLNAAKITSRIGILGKSLTSWGEAVSKTWADMKNATSDGLNLSSIRNAGAQARNFFGYLYPRESTFSDVDIEFFNRYNEFLRNNPTTGSLNTTAINNLAIGLENVSDSARNVVANAHGAAINIDELDASARTASVGMKLLATAGNMLITTAIAVGISTIIKQIGNWINASEIAQEKAEKFAESAKALVNESASNASSLSELNTEYQQLSKHVDSMGRNVDATADQYTRYKEIISQISDLMPDLAAYYDSQGEKIGFVTGKLGNLNDEYDELMKKQAASLLTTGNEEGETLEDLFEGFDTRGKTNFQDSLKNNFKSIAGFFGIDSLSLEAEDLPTSVMLNAFEKIRGKSRQEISNFLNDYTFDSDISPNVGESNAAKKIIENILGYDGDEIAELGDEEFNVIQQSIIENIEGFEAVYESEMQGITSALIVIARGNDDFVNLSDELQDNVTSILSSIDWSTWKGFQDQWEAEGKSVVTESLGFVNNVISSLNDQNGGLAKAWKELFQLEDEDLPVEEYAEKVSGYIDTICAALGIEGDDAKKQYMISLGFDIDDILESYNNAIEAAKNNKYGWTGEDFSENYLGLKKTLSDERKNLSLESKNLREDLEGMADAANLSDEKIDSLVKKFREGNLGNVYGNIDMDDRQVLEWTDETIDYYKKNFKQAFKDWDLSDVAPGDISTVLGGSSEFDGFEIAYSPMLQTDNGTPLLLTSKALGEYINSVLKEAGEDGSVTIDEILQIDAEGTGYKYGGEIVKGMIAGVTDSEGNNSDEYGALADSILMHYYDVSKIVRKAIKDTKAEFKAAETDFDWDKWFEDNSINTQEEIDRWLEIAEAAETAAEARKKYAAAAVMDNSLSLEEVKIDVNGSDDEDDTDGLVGEYKLVSELMANAGSSAEDLTETYEKLISCSSDYAAAIKIENGRVTVNTKTLKAVAKARIADKQSAIQETIALKNQQWLMWKNNIGEYRDMTLESVKANYDNIESLENEITEYSLLEQQLKNTSSAFSDFVNAQSTEDQDMYDTGKDAFDILHDYTLDSENENYGQYGSDEYLEAAKLLMPSDIYRQFLNAETVDEMESIVKSYIKTISPLFDDSNFNSAKKLFDLIEEIVASGNIPETDSEWAERLNISQDMFQMLKQLGNLYSIPSEDIFESYDLNKLAQYSSLIKQVEEDKEALAAIDDRTTPSYIAQAKALEESTNDLQEFVDENTSLLYDAYEKYEEAEPDEEFSAFLKTDLGYDDEDINGFVAVLSGKYTELDELDEHLLAQNSDLADSYEKDKEILESLGAAIGVVSTSTNETSIVEDAAEEEVATLEERIKQYKELRNEAIDTTTELGNEDLSEDESEALNQQLSECTSTMDEMRQPLEIDIKSNIDEIDGQIAELDEKISNLRKEQAKSLLFSDNEKYEESRDQISSLKSQKEGLESEKESLTETLNVVIDDASVDEWTEELRTEEPIVKEVTAEITELNTEYLDTKDVKVPTTAEVNKLNTDFLNSQEITVPVSGVMTSISNAVSASTSVSTSSSLATGQQTGTARINGTAHAGGSLGISKEEKNVMVGEVAPEMVVDPHEGTYTVYENPTMLSSLPKDAIVFNGDQTEDILKHGETKRFGSAMADGNVSGVAFKTGTGTKVNVPALKDVYNNDAIASAANSAKNTVNDAISDAADEAAEDAEEAFEEVIDWIERRVSALQAKIDKWTDQAETAISGSFIGKYFKKAKSNLKKELSAYAKAYTEYMSEANSSGLSEDYKKKVRNGTIDIETITDEALNDQISSYQEWYDKAQDAASSYIDAAETMYNIPLDKAAEKAEKFSDAISLIEKKLDNASSGKEQEKLIKRQMKQEKKTVAAYDQAEKTTEKAVKSAGKALVKSSNLNSDDGITKKERKQVKAAAKAGKEVDLSFFKEGSAGYNAAVKYNEAIKANAQASYDAEEAQEEYKSSMQELAEALYNIPLDEASEKVEELDDAISLLEKKADNAITSSAKNSLIDQQITEQRQSLQAYNEAAQQANSSLVKAVSNLSNSKNLGKDDGITASEKKAVKSAIATSQEVDLSMFKAGSAGYEAAVKYNEALKANKQALYDAQVAQEDYTAKLAELEKEKFDNIQSEFETYQKRFTQEATELDNALDTIEAKGRVVTADYYNSLISNEMSMISSLEEEKAKLSQQIQQSIASGGIKQGSEEWEEMNDEIISLTNAVAESKNEMLEWEKAIKELDWSNFERQQSLIERLNEESKFYIDLISHEELTDGTDEKGYGFATTGLTDYGIATKGLYAQQYATYLQEAQKYADKIAELRANGDMLSTDDIEQLQDWEDAQRDCILSAYDAKDAIIELIEDGYNALKESLDELIDKYKELLDSEKDEYEYQQSMKEKADALAALQKQYAAYSKDTSEETKATVQKLTVDIEDAEKEIAEAQYDKFISDTEEMLDDLSEDFGTYIEEAIKLASEDFEATLSELFGENSLIISTVNAAAANVGTTVSEELETVFGDGSAAESYMETVKSSISDIVGYASQIASSGADILAAAKASSVSANYSSTAAATSASSDSASTAQAAATAAASSSSSESSVATMTRGSNDSTFRSVSEFLRTSNKLKDTNKKKSEINSEVNKVIYTYTKKLTGQARILKDEDASRNALAKKLGTTWNGAGKNGNVYKKLKALGFRKGSRRIPYDLLAVTQEEGPEAIYKDGKILMPLNAGDMVFTNEMTDNLWKMAKEYPSFGGDASENAAGFMANVNTSMNQDVSIGEISLPGITTYEEFSQWMADAMNNDARVKKVMVNNTVGTLKRGYNSLSGKRLQA